jgi:tRNA(Ile)-lysidine synthase TilS/MesJ
LRRAEERRSRGVSVTLSGIDNMKTCTQCVLPETFPGIRFDIHGVCNYCLQARKKIGNLSEKKSEYHQRFLELLEKLHSWHDTRPYDVIIAYSGGKDSSFTLKVLKEQFSLRILSVTFNNGFLSSRALENIQAVTQVLGIDQSMISPSQETLFNAFRLSMNAGVYPLKSLERAGAVCNTCMNMVKSYLLRTAIEMGIPLIAYGWSPGQAPLQSSILMWNVSMLRKTQEATNVILKKVMEEGGGIFSLQEWHYRLLEERLKGNGKKFFCQIHPLAFLDYDEEKIVKEVESIGWVHPKDTDTNSTNCLLNALAINSHQSEYGFHPYAFEIAGLVREGYMSREAGLQKLSTPPDPEVVTYVREKLGIK